MNSIFIFLQKKHTNKKDLLVVNRDRTLIKWEDGGEIYEDHSITNSLPLLNKRCSPVSVITSPPCQPRTPTPINKTLQCNTLAATTTTATATSVLIKSESID